MLKKKIEELEQEIENISFKLKYIKLTPQEREDLIFERSYLIGQLREIECCLSPS